MARSSYPDLPEQFLLPKEWQRNGFVNPITDHHIHFNFALAKKAKGTIIVLPGLSEFGEKYIEFTNEALAKKFNVYIVDWAYQGRSSRFIPNAHKRYSDGFNSDLSDLYHLIQEHVPDNLPLIMLGHSMGAHIGLRFLQDYPDLIAAAGFTAPMVGIKDLKNYKKPIEWLLRNLPSIHSSYIPMGKNFSAKARPSNGKGIFSSDTLRDKIHNAWSLSAEELQVGNVTMKWVYESLKSCKKLNNPSNISKIITPIFIANASQEKLVDNKATEKLVAQLPNAELITLPNAKHEILMETDDIRDVFLEKFFTLAESVIKKSSRSILARVK